MSQSGVLDRPAAVAAVAAVAAAPVPHPARLEDVMAEMAHHRLHDPLTGLPNRTLLMERISAALKARPSPERGVTVLHLGLDGFTLINESLGHACGDEVLTAVAERLRLTVDAGDTVGRFSEDGFVIVCPGMLHSSHAATLARSVLDAVALPIPVRGRLIALTASAGISMGDAAASPDTLLRDAAAALQRARLRCPSSFEFSSEGLRDRVLRRFETEQALRWALERHELAVHYQPVAGLNGRVMAAEALVRWRRPGHGLVLPGDFIGIAEDTGVIGEIGAWVLERACRDAAAWPGEIQVSVNLSPLQLGLPDLVETVASVLGRTGLRPGRLMLEVTESATMGDAPTAARRLEQLRALGVELAVDDFGTGFASLAYLKLLPRFDVVKIDRSFVAGLVDDAGDRAIVRATVELAHAFGSEALAEGVETAEQVAVLRELGCDKLQGHHIGRAVPARVLADIVRLRRLPRPVSLPGHRLGWRVCADPAC